MGIGRQPYMKAYEDSNVDIGLLSGLKGRGQLARACGGNLTA